VIVCATLVATSAHAGDRADELKSRGDDALVSGRAAEALAAYREANAIEPSPALVFNIGRAQMALGDFVGALDSMEDFEKTAPADLRAKVPGLPKLLRELRAKVALVVVASVPSDASVSIGGRSVGSTPVSTPVKIIAGRIVVEVTKDGFYPWKHVIDFPGGTITPVDARLSSRQTSGVLVVTSSVAGAHVSIDGKPEGDVPSELVVPAGAHRVTVSFDGYRQTDRDTVVAAGAQSTVDVTLEREAPITKKWWFWTGIGLAVAGGVVTAIALTTERDPGKGNVAPGHITAGLRF
jgi:hypothetical protein